MVKALSDTARRAQQREQFQQDSLDALAKVQRTGLAHTLDDVENYCKQRALRLQSLATEPTQPPLTPWGGIARST